MEDLQGVEASFSDLHRRYEKTKGVVEGFKKVTLKSALQKINLKFMCMIYVLYIFQYALVFD